MGMVMGTLWRFRSGFYSDVMVQHGVGGVREGHSARTVVASGNCMMEV